MANKLDHIEHRSTQDLRNIYFRLKREGADPQLFTHLMTILQSSRTRENDIKKRAEYLQNVGIKIEKFDIGSFDGLKGVYEQLPMLKQAKILRLYDHKIKREMKRLNMDWQIKEVRRYLEKYDKCIGQIIIAMKDRKAKTARKWVGTLIKCNQSIEKILQKIESVQNMLLAVLYDMMKTE
ncbi:hypothetical protein JXB27_00020 [Candidatus Woesearchaeota archaeon]|nr:hypothetical protein [Candidatus Woesearchaeota archaeon]